MVTDVDNAALLSKLEGERERKKLKENNSEMMKQFELFQEALEKKWLMTRIYSFTSSVVSKENLQITTYICGLVDKIKHHVNNFFVSHVIFIRDFFASTSFLLIIFKHEHIIDLEYLRWFY